jgi:RecA-family ATPase
MVAQGTLALLGGPGGVGKSTLVAALEVAVAAGVPFLEREVAQGEVLHVDYDTDPRLQGPWYPKVAAGLGVNGEALGRIRYLEPQDPTKGLGEEGLKALLEMARQGPALIVLDSWSAAFPFVDPRRSDHVAEVMAYLKEIARAGPAVLLLDHTPKPVQGLTALERGWRGASTSWPGPGAPSSSPGSPPGGP